MAAISCTKHVTDIVKPEIKIDQRLVINCDSLDDCPEIPGCLAEYDKCYENMNPESCIDMNECLEHQRTNYIWVRYKALLDTINAYNKQVQ